MMPPMVIYHFAATASAVGQQLQFLHVTFALCNFLAVYLTSSRKIAGNYNQYYYHSFQQNDW